MRAILARVHARVYVRLWRLHRWTLACRLAEEIILKNPIELFLTMLPCTFEFVQFNSCSHTTICYSNTSLTRKESNTLRFKPSTLTSRDFHRGFHTSCYRTIQHKWQLDTSNTTRAPSNNPDKLHITRQCKKGLPFEQTYPLVCNIHQVILQEPQKYIPRDGNGFSLMFYLRSSQFSRGCSPGSRALVPAYQQCRSSDEQGAYIRM